MGIGGTAMGNGALLLREAGHEIYGTDGKLYPPMSDILAQSGITYWEGYDPSRLENLNPDLVVVGNAIARGNPEIEWLLATRRFKITSLPAILNELVLNQRRNIVVTGTHGKTTTAAAITHILRQNHVDAGCLIGGVPVGFSGAGLGDTNVPFVIEGDEYDTAFFDKRSKFIHYNPHIVVLNNLEFDHADIFSDLNDVKRTFNHLLRIVPPNGIILANGDDTNVMSLLPVTWASHLTVGCGEHNDLRIVGYHIVDTRAHFELHWRGQLWTSLSIPMTGLFNARNFAMASLATAWSQHPGEPMRFSPRAAESFLGVCRRQQCRFQNDRVILLEDFGHHPTAIAATLETLRQRYVGRTLIACFEPGSNTARTRIFQDAFTRALSLADQTYFAPVARAETLAQESRLDTVAMSENMRKNGISAHAYTAYDTLHTTLVQTLESADNAVMCVFSNGSMGGVLPKVLASLQSHA